jgi:hypothetical protein
MRRCWKTSRKETSSLTKGVPIYDPVSMQPMSPRCRRAKSPCFSVILPAGVPQHVCSGQRTSVTLLTSGAWCRSDRSDEDAGPGSWESIDRRQHRIAPRSAGFADFDAGVPSASFARSPSGAIPCCPCCLVPHGNGSQCREIILQVITHNVMIVAKITVFYRAGQEPFSGQGPGF